METSLHRQLKHEYADERAQFEVPLDKFRIDVVNEDHLVEIQHGSLAAIRDKTRQLLKNHRVVIVKPIIARKQLLKRAGKGGAIVGRRTSPKRGTILDLFDELVYFTRVFPHPRLTLEVPLVDVEESRYPGHGRRRRWRKNDFQIEDQRLLQIVEVVRFSNASDLMNVIPRSLTSPFHTGHLAEALDIQRWFAQRIAYCLRETGAVRQVGKQGNSLLYATRRRMRKAA